MNVAAPEEICMRQSTFAIPRWLSDPYVDVFDPGLFYKTIAKERVKTAALRKELTLISSAGHRFFLSYKTINVSLAEMQAIIDAALWKPAGDALVIGGSLDLRGPSPYSYIADQGIGVTHLIEGIGTVVVNSIGSRAKVQIGDSFWPSPELTSYLRLGGGELPSEGLIARHLRDAVIGIFQGVADARRFAGDSEPFKLSEKGRFVDSITEALVQAVRFDRYRTKEFLTQLYAELYRSTPLGVNEWTLNATSDGSLRLAVTALESKSDAPQVKAKVARLKLGKRFGTSK